MFKLVNLLHVRFVVPDRVLYIKTQFTVFSPQVFKTTNYIFLGVLSILIFGIVRFSGAVDESLCSTAVAHRRSGCVLCKLSRRQTALPVVTAA